MTIVVGLRTASASSSRDIVSQPRQLGARADDYLTFARLFVDGGACDGVRILRPDTGALLVSNQLTPMQRTEARMRGRPLFAQGHGCGMGVAVVMEPDQADVLRCRGDVGTVGWPGAHVTQPFFITPWIHQAHISESSPTNVRTARRTASGYSRCGTWPQS